MTNSPFNDPQRNPLPDANDIERNAANDLESSSFREIDDTHTPSPHIQKDIRWMRNMLIWLLVTGALLGCVLGVVIVIFLKRSGLAEPPEQPTWRRTVQSQVEF